MKVAKISFLSIGPLALGLLFLSTESFTPPSVSSSTVPHCSKSGQTVDPLLPSSSSSILRKLAEYETVCHGAVASELMVFLSMPQTESQAVAFAKDASQTLQEFERHHIAPLVLFEPSTSPTFKLSLVQRGTYDKALQTYFTSLKNLGIHDKAMGTWVLFPEANTPTWGSTDPAQFVLNVKKVGGMQKAVFPDSKISVLLNSRTYPTGDSLWNHGSFKSLAPYLKELPDHLVDRLGYQGFPSVSPAHALDQYTQLDARDFLPASLIVEAAKLTGIHDIWLNTGSFRHIYTNDSRAEVRLSPAQRRSVLQSVLYQVAVLKTTGLRLSLNLFAEDKSRVSEHIDWSYWQTGSATTSPDTETFTWFAGQLQQANVAFSLYDHS